MLRSRFWLACHFAARYFEASGAPLFVSSINLTGSSVAALTLQGSKQQSVSLTGEKDAGVDLEGSRI